MKRSRTLSAFDALRHVLLARGINLEMRVIDRRTLEPDPSWPPAADTPRFNSAGPTNTQYHEMKILTIRNVAVLCSQALARE